ncbi:hypothetical protein KY284_032528 [Solanum tuberosum]|nr:hypothetical protein KY284_032528 [Solanum tuberosum]
MSQQGPSRKIKTTKKKTYAKPGTLSSLVQQRRTFLTTQETLQAVQLEKKNLLKSIEKEQPIAKQQRVAQLVEANEQCVEEQAIVDEQPIEEEQLQVDSTTSDPSTQKNKRGTTQMQRVHGRNERKLILLNNNNQPVGPTNDVVLELSSFLGTLARNATLCPLDILDWRYMDTKDDLWTYTQGKYDIPEDAREWALDVIGYAWRRHKFELKKDSDKHKKMAETNTRNRKKLMNPHTAGKISFALVRNNLEEKKESTVSLKELFVVTRTRHPERSYKGSNEDTITKIVEMEEIEKQQSVDSTDTADPFSSVMRPEHPGRLRLYGRGVTKTSLKRKAGNSEPIINATNDAVQQMQERIQKMEEQMEVQRSTIQQDVTTNIIAHLQRA